MKILIITKTLSIKDGQGRYSMGLIKELAKNHSLTVLTAEWGKSSAFKDMKVNIIEIPDLLSIRDKILKCLKYFFLVWRYQRGKDFVHFFSDLPNYLIFSPLIFLNLKPYFITFHGTFGISFLDKSWRRPFLKRFYKRAKKVFCISNFTKNEILKRVKLDNLVVINNGVDFERFDTLYQKFKNQIKKSSCKNLISVGAIKPRKGYEYSLRALNILKQKYSNIKYFIVGNQGNKAYLNELKKIIEQCDLKNNVCFLENISDQELVKLYIQADLFLFTPVNYEGVYFEGFGLVCLEAGVCEKPIVGSLDCGVEDAVKDNITGYLVPQKGPNQIAQAVDKILSDRELAQKMGEQGRRWAKEMDWKNVMEKYVKLYETRPEYPNVPECSELSEFLFGSFG